MVYFTERLVLNATLIIRIPDIFGLLLRLLIVFLFLLIYVFLLMSLSIYLFEHLLCLTIVLGSVIVLLHLVPCLLNVLRCEPASD